MRVRMGVYQGVMDRVAPHARTGCADYFGQPANRAARLMTAAFGGQVCVCVFVCVCVAVAAAAASPLVWLKMPA